MSCFAIPAERCLTHAHRLTFVQTSMLTVFTQGYFPTDYEPTGES